MQKSDSFFRAEDASALNSVMCPTQRAAKAHAVPTMSSGAKLLLRALAARASSSGSMPNSRLATANAVAAKCGDYQWSVIRGMAAAESAASRGACANLNVANDLAVQANCCMENSLSRRIEEAAIEVKRGGCRISKVAKDQEMNGIDGGKASVRRGIADAAIECIRGLCGNHNLEQAHAMPSIPTGRKSDSVGIAAEEVASRNGRAVQTSRRANDHAMVAR